MKAKVVFVHGGPGLNSNPEKNLISQIYEQSGLEIHFWNEPRELQTDDPYTFVKSSLIDYINSFNAPVTLLAHSWGCRLVIDCINEIESNVNGACFISPAVDFKNADRKICKLGKEILNNQKASTEKIKKFLAVKTDDLDEIRFEALAEAFCSNYFVKNFINEENMKGYFQYLTDENEFRASDMISIRRSMELAPTSPTRRVKLPTTAIFGKLDPIFTKSSESKVLEEVFSNLKPIELEDQSHYCHIEKPEIVLKEILNLI